MLLQAQAELNMSLQAKKKIINKAVVKPEQQSRRISHIHSPTAGGGQLGVFVREGGTDSRLQQAENKARIVDRLLTVNLEPEH